MYGDNGKYIVVKDTYGENTYIFPAIVNHSAMARNVGGEIISAGFINYRLECYGESVTLKVKAREKEDTELVRRKLFGFDDREDYLVNMASFGSSCTKELNKNKREKLAKILVTMDLPEQRIVKMDLHWLKRNIEIRNKDHERIHDAKYYIDSLLGE